MNTIMLVFVMSTMTIPIQSQGPAISERVFTSKQECADFVNMLANQEVVGEHGEPNMFDFVSEDGFRFTGGCFTTEEYMKWSGSSTSTN